jgi:hypothetical protein
MIKGVKNESLCEFKKKNHCVSFKKRITVGVLKKNFFISFFMKKILSQFSFYLTFFMDNC